MKKVFFTLLLAGFATMGYAQETYNFFDPADCDAEGWLWLDSAEKIDKYCGESKKIMFVDSNIEIDDPEWEGEKIMPKTVADPELQGYNTEGVKGGEGSKTGGIILGKMDERWWDDRGAGGILVHLPDCAQFDLYLSCEHPEIFTYLKGSKGHVSADECKYIWNEDDPSFFYPEDGPISSNYVCEYLNVQEHSYEISYENGEEVEPYLLSFAAPLGEKRTAFFSNYSYGELYIHGIRIKTYTDVSAELSAVEGVVADVDVKIAGKVVYAPAVGEISVYSVNGVKVASAYADSLDCSDLSGLYIVKAGNKAVKVVF